MLAMPTIEKRTEPVSQNLNASPVTSIIIAVGAAFGLMLGLGLFLGFVKMNANRRRKAAAAAAEAAGAEYVPKEPAGAERILVALELCASCACRFFYTCVLGGRSARARKYKTYPVVEG